VFIPDLSFLVLASPRASLASVTATASQRERFSSARRSVASASRRGANCGA
jgi:hypothetical protein